LTFLPFFRSLLALLFQDINPNQGFDDRNPTGYVQVLDEVQNRLVSRAYVYGLELIEQDRISNFHRTTSYNVYDGHGSVRGRVAGP
jgi:hypothetical protein